MAKQDLSRHQEGIVKRYYNNQDTIQSNKLGDLLSELWLADNEKTKAKLWGKAQVALMRMGVDATKVASIVGKMDLEGLAKLIKEADAGTAPGMQADGAECKSFAEGGPKVKSVADGRTIKQMQEERAGDGGYDSLEEPNLKRALKAFRKKLKAYRLDDESRIGGRNLTGGKASSISAITPPNQYPPEVWVKLAELGRLKRVQKGLYELP